MNTTRKVSVSLMDRKATYTLILINLALFVLINMVPGLEDGLLMNPELQHTLERPWTLATVFFSHKMLLHLVLNMVLLYVFGLELERLTNSKLVFALYLMAGLAGSIVIIPTAVLTGAAGLVAGASASVFGIVTAFAVLRPDQVVLKSKAKWWALSLFVFNVATMFTSPDLSGAAAHMAGMTVGLGTGWWIRTRRQEGH